MSLRMLSVSVLSVLAVAVLTSASTPVAADTLLIQRVERAKQSTLPRRGSLMSEVEARYGAPTERIDAVGQPPISRWVYPAFTVYFEHQHVINAVVNKSSEVEQGPKPAPPQKPNR